MKLSTIEIAHILLWVAYKTPIWNSLLPHHIQAFQFLFLKGFSKHTSTFPQPQEEHWELLIYLIKIFAKYILYICMFFFVKPLEGGLLGPHHLQVNYRTKMTLGIKSRIDLLWNFLTIHVQLQLTCTWSGSSLRFLRVADTKKYIKPKFLLKPKV